MSHLIEIRVEVRDRDALAAACWRLQLPQPEHRTVSFYDGSSVTGEAVQLPDWRYPVVFDLEGGVKYDDFAGRWGQLQHLDALLQQYAVAKATIEARRAGHTVRETKLPGGRIKLTLTPLQTQQAVSA